MLIVAGTLRIVPERLDAARPAMADVIAANRAEEGCLTFSYAEDVLEPGLIRVFEIWRSRADFDRHLASDHLVAWRAAGPALGIGDRNLQVYETPGPSPA